MRKPGVEEGRRWLDQAREDLKWARRLADEGGYHLACFLAQQVAEKAIKGFLYAKGESLVLGHSVAVLAEKAEQHDARVAQKAILDEFGVRTRPYVEEYYMSRHKWLRVGRLCGIVGAER